MKVLALLCVATVAYADPAPTRGAHPRPDDWVVYYGGGKYESREIYCMPRVAQARNVFSFDITSMVVGETRQFSSATNVVDVELVAILGAKPPGQQALFPAPNDATVTARGDRFVTVNAGKPGGARPGDADHVFFDVAALDENVKRVDVGTARDMPTLADVRVPAIADAVRDMDPGETRYVWAHHDGKPLFMRITLYSVEKRVQVPAPSGIAQPPAGAATVNGMPYLVLAPGSGEPIDIADDVTIQYVVWSPTGRTIEMSPSSTQTASSYQFRDQLTDMRVGEHRRIWMPPQEAGYYSEVGRGAIADVTVIGLHRNIELLPRGLRIAHQRGSVEVVRGATRATLPAPIVTLEAAKLVNGRVELSGEDVNDMPVSVTMPLAQLDARLDEVESLSALRAGRFDDAIASATHALAAAPELDSLYFDLARAYLAAGKPHDAARALSPLAARNPVEVYVQIHEDPGLAVLAAEPEIAKLRVTSPAPIDLAKEPVLVDRAGRFVAVELTEASWGSGDAETRIEIIELATGKGITTIGHVAWSFESQPMTARIDADVAQRTSQVAAWLAELGFSAPKNIESGVVTAAGRGEPATVTFAKAKLVVDETGAVKQGTKVIGHAPGADSFNAGAFWLPHERAIVYIEGRPGHECCESTDPVWAEITKL